MFIYIVNKGFKLKHLQKLQSFKSGNKKYIKDENCIACQQYKIYNLLAFKYSKYYNSNNITVNSLQK